MSKAIKQKPFLFFLLFTFVFSWITGFSSVIVPGKFEGLAFLSGFGPAVGALIVVGIVEGSDGIKKLIQSLFQWKIRIVWYFVVLLGPALTMAIAVLFYNMFAREGSAPNFNGRLSDLPQHILIIGAVFLFTMFGIWGEEIGWRGFALPKLQKAYHPVLASLILGAIWAIWHLPLFFTEGSPQAQMGMPYFFFATLGYSILYSWIYNGTKESLFMIWLLHSANNATVSYTMLFFEPLTKEPVFSLAVLGFFDALIILFTKSNLLYQREVEGIYDNK
ncbi:MAG: CPBP family intramembrane metalloprotease [Chloroflexi bacterium]|nr:CPBP family intramembrane metalloprotease [Chloroflexota bacterium]